MADQKVRMGEQCNGEEHYTEYPERETWNVSGEGVNATGARKSRGLTHR